MLGSKRTMREDNDGNEEGNEDDERNEGHGRADVIRRGQRSAGAAVDAPVRAAARWRFVNGSSDGARVAFGGEEV